MKTSEAHVQLKPGIIGVRVKIMPADAYFPDKVQIAEAEPPAEEQIQTPKATAASAPTPASIPAPAEEAPVKAEEVADEPKPEAPEPQTQETKPAEETKQ